ncbi:MurR/RpiR family transcriptional regulator [Mesomycoplasma neurolyticum]|uniref:Transcriptional regulator, rpir family n=1 Tax=Mesomycoplasma neurolyticum TaxID=2120 RepID=A0A449A6J2_9BACT|nr:MurR/RpiR family transcriptional regulator [Mesomycoplasma neurolyticum]VEU59837.1 transcriptional regulator, rpir family [Mesomycoplasma neurolyticum]
MKNNSIIESKILKNLKLSNSNQQILNFIETNTDKFLKLNTLSLARETNLSQSTVSRFSWNLGFNSLNDLQVYVSQRQMKLKMFSFNKVDEILTVDDVISNIKSHYLFAVQETVDIIKDNDNIKKYINTLFDYRKLNVFFGIGESAMVAKYFAKNLRKIGFNTIFIEQIHDFFSFSDLLKEKMHITLISKSCETLEIKNIIKYSNENKVAYSIWTKNHEVANNEYLKNVLVFNSQNQNYRISSIGSKISAFILADIIFAHLSWKIDRNKTIFSSIDKSIKEWNDLIDKVKK